MLGVVLICVAVCVCVCSADDKKKGKVSTKRKSKPPMILSLMGNATSPEKQRNERQKSAINKADDTHIHTPRQNKNNNNKKEIIKETTTIQR